MISRTADYALRAVVYLGNQESRSSNTAQLADEIDAHPECLAKVMQGLNRAGIVDSQRGLHSGSTLAHHPNELTILDVVNSVDACHRITRCPLGRLGPTSGLCPLHRRMDNVMAAAGKSPNKTSIGEVLEEPGLVCHLPCLVEAVDLEYATAVQPRRR